MADVTSAEVQRNFGLYREMAEGAHGKPEPVMVVHDTRPSVVIIAASEYARLKRRDKRVLATEHLPEWLVNQIGKSEMDLHFARLDESG
jgi:hypothetical protein